MAQIKALVVLLTLSMAFWVGAAWPYPKCC